MSELSEKVRAKFNSEMFDHDKRPSEAMEAALAPVEAEIMRLREALKPFTLKTEPYHNVYGYEHVFVTPEQLRAARAAMGESDE